MCRLWKHTVTLTLGFLVVLVTVFADHTESTPFPEEFDHRYVSYEELVNPDGPFQIFQSPDIVDHVALTVDIPRNQLIVGARGKIFALGLQNMTASQEVEYTSPPDIRQSCLLKGKSEEECHNFVRVLLIDESDNEIITCGTNSFKPRCTRRKMENMNNITEEMQGTALCPFDPQHNSTAVLTSDGNFYSGSVIDFAGMDSIIYRGYGDRPRLRTKIDPNWLNGDPQFVSSYEIGDFVYFFFREAAVEYSNCGKKIYSRVARVCKSDRGGRLILENHWTTFLKTRLNCSLSGTYPFYFDELQSTHLVESVTGEKFIFGVFTTPNNGMLGSAICMFNMTAFQTALTGDFKYKETSDSAWTRHVNTDPQLECPSDDITNKRTVSDVNLVAKQSQLLMATQFQLMDAAVQPETQDPLLVGTNERYTHIVVTSVEGKEGKIYWVFYVATQTGYIQKMTRLPDYNITCLLEKVKVVPNGEHRPIKGIAISEESEAVVVAIQEKIVKIPFHRCERYTTVEACKNSMDPYCGWNSGVGQCTTAPEGRPSLHYWEQSMTSCPVVEHPVNGQWSNWTDWSDCPQNSNDPSAGSCLCRTRMCDNPKPMFNGLPCEGPSVQVTNCTTHGQWTEWTQWSQCSISCGYNGTRTRQRFCSNPPPKFGGNPCPSIGTDQGYCPGNPRCPEPPVDGNWAPWSAWSKCTADCNGGIETRRRLCNNPSPERGGLPCIGNENESRMCNTQPCEEISELTAWSPWFLVNSTRSGRVEEKFRFECHARVPNKQMIRMSHAETQLRFCSKRGNTCDYPANLQNITQHGGWSSWSSWNSCSESCGGGLQSRSRTCDNPEPMGFGDYCRGDSREYKTCNLHSCFGTWGCWTEFSGCSVTCGSGSKYRIRKCNGSAGCPGGEEEHVPCYQPSCNDSLEWSPWAPWSPCSMEGLQFKKRHCLIKNPLPHQCQGRDIESKSCLDPDREIKLQPVISSDGIGTERNYTPFHLVVVGTTAFVFGALCMIGIYLCFKSCRSFKKYNVQKEMSCDMNGDGLSIGAMPSRHGSMRNSVKSTRSMRSVKSCRSAKHRKPSVSSQGSVDLLGYNNRIYDCNTLPVRRDKAIIKDSHFIRKTPSSSVLRSDLVFDV